MGTRGPSRTPLEVLKRRGAPRAKRREAETAAPVYVHSIEPPADLRKDAIGIWAELNSRLDKLGILAETDKYALVLYCETWAKYRECEAFLEAHGSTYKSKSREGGIVIRRYPQADYSQEYVSQLSRLGAKLGLSPADRTNVKADTTTQRKSQDKIRHFQLLDKASS